jgi:HEAT repeat protein
MTDMASLLAQLGNERKTVQRGAAEALRDLANGGAPVREALLVALGAPSLRQRWGAAYALGLLGDPPAECLPVLVETLGADDGDMRWAASTLVLRMPAPTVAEALGRLAREGTALQRKMALYGLRDLGGPVAEAMAALDDPDTGVRLAAMAALARAPADPQEAATRLAPMLGDADVGVRRAAAAALGRVGVAAPVAVDALRVAAAGADEPLRRAAERALAALLSR